MQINNLGRSLSETPAKGSVPTGRAVNQILSGKSVYWVPYLKCCVMDISPTETQDVSLSMRKQNRKTDLGNI